MTSLLLLPTKLTRESELLYRHLEVRRLRLRKILIYMSDIDHLCQCFFKRLDDIVIAVIGITGSSKTIFI